MIQVIPTPAGFTVPPTTEVRVSPSDWICEECGARVPAGEYNGYVGLAHPNELYVEVHRKWHESLFGKKKIGDSILTKEPKMLGAVIESDVESHWGHVFIRIYGAGASETDKAWYDTMSGFVYAWVEFLNPKALRGCECCNSVQTIGIASRPR